MLQVILIYHRRFDKIWARRLARIRALTKKGASLRCPNDGGSQRPRVRISPGPLIKRVFIAFTLLNRPFGQACGQGHRRLGREGRRDRDNLGGRVRQPLLNQGGRQNGGGGRSERRRRPHLGGHRHGGLRDCHSLIYHPRNG